MPLRGLAKAKNFTLGPTAPMKTFTENIHIQTKESNDLRNSLYCEINQGKHLCSIERADDVNINIKKFIENV